VLGFGIHGALVSGRIAARAVDDPEGAASEFREVTRYLVPAMLLWRVYGMIPIRDWLYGHLAGWKDLVLLSSWLPERAIPGSRPAGWPGREKLDGGQGGSFLMLKLGSSHGAPPEACWYPRSSCAAHPRAGSSRARAAARAAGRSTSR